ncbi:MAG: phosphoribosylformylglycinamidine synthase subunit PurQ [Acidobacteriales bacterium]|nr:phosphoribosylformylglycinamidine synthase subunit PurQ [Terriglobales bacterium]
MKFGVLVFPGSNCDQDAFHIVANLTKQPVVYLWHETHDLEGCDAVIVPGGFAYGDYLRTGALARFSPVMESVRKFADRGGLVLGICNGFQILCESELLPGALLRNAGLKYICKPVHLRVESAATPFTQQCEPGDVLRIPIGHMEGNYVCDQNTHKTLLRNERIIFRYCDEQGEAIADANPNGSLDNIAGICNEGRNVLGMMPHPDRAAESVIGSSDGLKIFESMVGALTVK